MTEDEADDIRRKALDDAAKIADEEYDRVFADVCQRANQGIAAMRAKPCLVIAEKIRAMKP